MLSVACANRKYPLETRENIYTIIMTSRKPRQIVGFDVDYDKESNRMQTIVDSTNAADNYYTDGNPTYPVKCKGLMRS